MLRLDDFLEEGWRRRPGGEPAAPGGDHALGRLLASHFPEEHVAGAADSAAFVRPPALAFSTAVVLGDDAAGDRAFGVVASPGLASSFADAIADDVAVDGATFLGAATSPLALGPGPGEAAAHRTAFAGATGDALVPAYVDLVALRARRRLVVLFLANAPGPFPTDELDHVVARVRARLAGA